MSDGLLQMQQEAPPQKRHRSKKMRRRKTIKEKKTRARSLKYGSSPGLLRTTHKARCGRITALGLRQIDAAAGALTARGSFASPWSARVHRPPLGVDTTPQLRTWSHVGVNEPV